MRPRLSNPHLPKYVQHRHGGYYLVKGGKWELLGRDLDAALVEYRKRTAPPTDGLPGLVDAALAARRPKLAPNTWTQYEAAGAKIKHMLAEFRPEQVLPRHVAQLKRQLAATPNMANRVLSVLRLVFDFALESQLVDSNPAIGIKRLPEKKRRRLIAHAEYQAIYAKAPARLQCVMDLLFLTGQRVEDVLQIRLADLRDDGIYFEQDKTAARLVVAWTPELAAVVARAKGLLRGVSGFTLLQGRKGRPVDYRTVYLQWKTACKAGGIEDAQIRDLRAMAATAIRAQGGNATALLGHKSAAMTDRYLRDKTVPLVAGPSFVVPIKPAGKKTA